MDTTRHQTISSSLLIVVSSAIVWKRCLWVGVWVINKKGFPPTTTAISSFQGKKLLPYFFLGKHNHAINKIILSADDDVFISLLVPSWSYLDGSFSHIDQPASHYQDANQPCSFISPKLLLLLLLLASVRVWSNAQPLFFHLPLPDFIEPHQLLLLSKTIHVVEVRNSLFCQRAKVARQMSLIGPLGCHYQRNYLVF